MNRENEICITDVSVKRIPWLVMVGWLKANSKWKWVCREWKSCLLAPLQKIPDITIF